jgi:hypothetical protein
LPSTAHPRATPECNCSPPRITRSRTRWATSTRCRQNPGAQYPVPIYDRADGYIRW